jgi:hypothetical protein
MEKLCYRSSLRDRPCVLKRHDKCCLHPSSPNIRSRRAYSWAHRMSTCRSLSTDKFFFTIAMIKTQNENDMDEIWKFRHLQQLCMEIISESLKTAQIIEWLCQNALLSLFTLHLPPFLFMAVTMVTRDPIISHILFISLTPPYSFESYTRLCVFI